MRQVTLSLPITDDKIILAMKKEGFGVGKWNGAGGKILEGESIEVAAIREMKEEIGIKGDLSGLSKVGNIKFYFLDKPEFDQQMHVFLVKSWSGELTESDEMKPRWFRHSEIPYENMWVDDRYWLPKVLVGKKIEASFYFKDGGESIERYEIKEI